MNNSPFRHPQPFNHDDYAPLSGSPDGLGAGDASLARLVAQLDALGVSGAAEARERGLSDRVFERSMPLLESASPVIGRLAWNRWAVWASAAALLSLAALIPLGVLPGSDDGASTSPGVETAAFKPGDFAPAGLSERLVIGLYDRDAALASIDLINGDGGASVVVAHGHDADAVALELSSLLSVGGGK